MHTFLDSKKSPIIRSCYNCTHFEPIENQPKAGYCKRERLMFAFTMEKHLYPMVKTYYLCESHRLPNEEFLESTQEKIDLRSILKAKTKQ